jgi:hypothetical protein
MSTAEAAPEAETRSPQFSGYVPVDTSAVGEFPWSWNLSGTFNGQTWDYLNNVAAIRKDGFVTLTAGLITAYYNVISKIAYTWTDADRSAIGAQVQEIQNYADIIISCYISKFNAIGPSQKKEAALALGWVTADALSYVIDYKIGYVWSGRQEDKQLPLTPQQLRASGDLASLFNKAPDGAKVALFEPLKQLVDAQRCWIKALASLQLKSAATFAAATNTINPEIDKSGIYVVDANGENAVRPSFTVVPTVAEIGQLLSSTNTLVVVIPAEKATGGNSKVSMPLGKETLVPNTFCRLESDQQEVVDVFSLDGTGDKADLKITYHGPAEIGIKPAPFDPGELKGWFHQVPIQLAAANLKTRAAGGYQFQLTMPLDFSVGGNFGFLSSLLVCRAVTLEVSYPNGNLKALSANFPVGKTMSARLFGTLHIQGGFDTPLIGKVVADEVTGLPSIVLTDGGSGSLATAPGKLAHVIGAKVFYPGAAPPGFAAASAGASTAVSAAVSENRTMATESVESLVAADPGPEAQNAIVKAYEEIFGSITGQQISEAQTAIQNLPSTAFDYVLRYVLAYDWSGRMNAHEKPMTLNEMRTARNLLEVLPRMPISGSRVVTELAAYLSTYRPNLLPGKS